MSRTESALFMIRTEWLMCDWSSESGRTILRVLLPNSNELLLKKLGCILFGNVTEFSRELDESTRYTRDRGTITMMSG